MISRHVFVLTPFSPRVGNLDRSSGLKDENGVWDCLKRVLVFPALRLADDNLNNNRLPQLFYETKLAFCLTSKLFRALFR